MFVFQVEQIFPVNAGCNVGLSGIAFDGCSFWLTAPKRCEIYQVSNNFCKKQCFPVKRPYTSICWDKGWNCFWALAEGCGNHIFQLDSRLCEVGCITVKEDACKHLRLTGVSDSGDCSRLMISTEDIIGIIRKDGCGRLQILQRKPGCFHYNSVLDMELCYLGGHADRCESGIALYSRCNQLEANCVLPPGYEIVDMTAGSRGSCNSQTVYILAMKGCQRSPYILQCSLSNRRKEKKCFERESCSCCSKPNPRPARLLHGIF